MIVIHAHCALLVINRSYRLTEAILLQYQFIRNLLFLNNNTKLYVLRGRPEECHSRLQGCGNSRIFLLPPPAPHKVSRFRVCFRFYLLSSKCFRFHKNITAFHRLSFRFHISGPYCMKNASTSGSSKIQMLPLCFRFQLLSSKCFRFHKNLKPLPQKFNTASSFRFYILV